MRSCTTTREFVTSLSFLRSEKEFQIPEEQARKIASRVAVGCTGAAKRFIQITRALVAAGLASRDALEEGIAFAPRTDTETDTFLTIFRVGFLQEHLDLDLRSALTLARALSKDFEGDIAAVRDDFLTLVDFCVRSRTLDLPRPQCAYFAVQTAKKGQRWSGGVGIPFVRLFKFMTQKKGPNMTTAQALKLAQEMVVAGPDSAENFIQGYRFATSRSGLNLSARDALTFARDLVFSPEKAGRSSGP